MSDIVKMFEGFGDLTNDRNAGSLIEEIKQAHQFKRQIDARIAVFSGIRLLVLRDELRYGKLDQLYEELDISDDTARNYMTLAKVFRDDPSCLDGIGTRKALAMTKNFSEEDIVTFKADGIWIGPDKAIYTHAQIVEMTSKQFQNELLNKVNQKNKEIKEYRDEMSQMKVEMDRIRKQDKEREEFTQKLMKDKDAAFSERVGNLEKQAGQYLEQVRKIQLELMELRGSEAEETRVLEAVEAAMKAVDDVFFMTGTIALTPERTELGRQLLKFGDFMTRTASMFTMRLHNQLDKGMPGIDSEA